MSAPSAATTAEAHLQRLRDSDSACRPNTADDDRPGCVEAVLTLAVGPVFAPKLAIRHDLDDSSSRSLAELSALSGGAGVVIDSSTYMPTLVREAVELAFATEEELGAELDRIYFGAFDVSVSG